MGLKKNFTSPEEYIFTYQFEKSLCHDLQGHGVTLTAFDSFKKELNYIQKNFPIKD